MRRYKIQRQNDSLHIDADYYKISDQYLELYKQDYTEPKLLATIKNWEYIIDLQS